MVLGLCSFSIQPHNGFHFQHDFSWSSVGHGPKFPASGDARVSWLHSILLGHSGLLITQAHSRQKSLRHLPPIRSQSSAPGVILLNRSEQCLFALCHILTTRSKKFWKDSVAKSKNGHFSFWIGKNHIVGISGEAARKMHLDSHDLDPIGGIMLIGHGPDAIDGKSSVIPPIWTTTMANSRLFAHRRILDLQNRNSLRSVSLE